MSKLGFLSKKREAAPAIIESNREATTPPARLEVEAIPQRPTGLRYRIGTIEVLQRSRQDEAQPIIASASQPKNGEEVVQRTFRTSRELDQYMEKHCDGNWNGYVQGLLIYALKSLEAADKTLQVAFVNEDGTPIKRIRNDKKKSGETTGDKA